MILIILDRDGTLIEPIDFLGRNKNWDKEIRLNIKLIKILNNIDKEYYKNIKIVVTNQTGVARKLFTENTVKKINKHIDYLLKEKNITINNWQYSPEADLEYAKKTGYYFNWRYVKTKSNRKPSPDLVLKALSKLKLKINDFNHIIVFGDRPEDKQLSENLNAIYFDVTRKSFNNKFVFNYLRNKMSKR